MDMETILGLAVGIGLSAACGFRVFVPLLGMSLAAHNGYVTLSPGFAWLGSQEALIAFGTATVVEIAAYHIPWVDNTLDALMTPLSVVAGTLLTASLLGDLSPLFKWSLAIIAGGGVSAIVQGGTVALRAGSTSATGGLANVVVSTIELIGSIIVTILAILLPLLGLAAVIWICYRMITTMARSTFFKNLFT
jgi:hypothetical protein